MRVDTGVAQGDDVSVYYDPMIAKVIAHGNTRLEAITRLDRALGTSYIGGISSNINLVRACLSHPQFKSGEVSTGFVEQNKSALFEELKPPVTREDLLEGTVAHILFNVIFYKVFDFYVY